MKNHLCKHGVDESNFCEKCKKEYQDKAAALVRRNHGEKCQCDICWVPVIKKDV